MPHGGAGSGRRQEKRCWLPNGDIVYVEEGTDCPGISGQEGSGRRRLYWEREGELISRAPAATPGPTWRTHAGGRRREEEIAQKDDRPAYHGGGYGFPKISQTTLSEDYAPVVPTIWGALLAGLGIGLGFAVVNKIAKS